MYMPRPKLDKKNNYNFVLDQTQLIMENGFPHANAIMLSLRPISI